MGKLFLPARVPNEGARRLAAWLQSVPPVRAIRAMGNAGIDAAKVDRLIAGELIPGADERWAIACATGHAVYVRDWSVAACGRWGDPVPARMRRRAA
ncbi:hypothetical protein [Sphingomonas hankookensis]|uniref:hypothetical protein n=1 Tax=Sphingomonas hankookensis TaxID=563996 RepID=UPI003D301902